MTTVTRQVITWKPGNERLRVNFSGENGRNWPERVQSVKVLGENPVTFMKPGDIHERRNSKVLTTPAGTK